MKNIIALVIGIVVAGISCYGAGQSQGYHPEKRALHDPIVMQVEAAEPKTSSVGFMTSAGTNPFSDVRMNTNGSAPYTDDFYKVVNNPVSITTEKEESTVQQDMTTNHIQYAAQQTLKNYNVSIPQNIKDYCTAAGNKYGICPELLMAMCWKESSCNPDAVNGDCIGIMQVSVTWHTDRMADVGATSLTDPQDCINVAADYLADLIEEYPDVPSCLEIYNGDSKVGDGYISDYANDVLTVAYALERADGK